MPKLDPTIDLSYANVNTTAVMTNEFQFEEFEIVLPEISWAILKEHDSELLNGVTEQVFNEDEDVRERLVEKFQDSHPYEEWRDSFFPVMLYYWPVCLPYGSDATEIATLIDHYAGCVSLIKITDDDLETSVGETHALVLTGGGMDLSDRLAIAYLCCGVVPPQSLLESASRLIRSKSTDRVEPEVKALFSEALIRMADYFTSQANVFKNAYDDLVKEVEPA